MKKKTFSLLALCALCAGASAQTVTVADVEAVPGETVWMTLDLAGGKADTYTSLQFTATFPTEGFTTTGDYQVSRQWSGASSVVGDVFADGTAIVPVSSANAISGADVEGLFSMAFTVDDDVPLGDYEVTLSDITFGYGFTDKDIAPDVTFTVRVVSAHSIVLDENSTVAPTSATGVNVTVKRTINAGEWTTICLPFALNGEQMVEAFVEGVQVADFTAWSSEEDSEGDITRITLGFETVTEMEANHPYIINVAEDITEFTLDGVDISPEEEPSVQVGKKKAERGFLTGTYVVADVPEEGLVLDGGQFAYSDGTRQTVAFSAYFELADALTDTGTAAACIDIVLDGVSIPTAIGTAMDNTGVRGTAFTLGGIRVSKAVKGLYIQDGRIVLKK